MEAFMSTGLTTEWRENIKEEVSSIETFSEQDDKDSSQQ